MPKKPANKGLGRGLSALLPTMEEEKQKSGAVDLFVSEIKPSPYQPRTAFDAEKLKELAESIRTYGVVQPIIVRKTDEGYELISGERRLKAAKLIGLKEIPALIKEYTDQEAMEIALIENVQREDLNIMEEAGGYQELMKKLDLTQEELAKRIGKSRSYIANTLRLLRLPNGIQKQLIDGEITMGHARALLTLENPVLMMKIAKELMEKGWNVRQTEAKIKEIVTPKEEKPSKKTAKSFSGLDQKEWDRALSGFKEQMEERLGTHVAIKQGKTKGKIEIEYYDVEDLERILEFFA